MPDAFPRAAYAGDRDVADAASVLASRLPEGLRELAAVAFDYRWSWTRDGAATFAAIDSERFARVNQNPVRLLRETPGTTLQAVADDPDVRARVRALAEEVLGDRARDGGRDPSRPVAFFCAEFGVHASLPIYSGGLGVLAGDVLKEASDRGLPMVGVGLLYRHGYFHQRLDPRGKQHEYWTDVDPEQLPTVLVTGDDDEPLTVSVRIRGEDVVARIWRTDVGGVPLYLLDADEPRNSPLSRWITGRLYEGNREIRLAQYALLGVGGMRALRALRIDPEIVHLNEGHPALATLELAHELCEDGRPFDDALGAARARVVFTTHTPVPAGNETYSEAELMAVLGDLVDEVGVGRDGLLRLARIDPDDAREPPGMTPLAIRTSRSTNGVSAVHGRVAREMWQPMFAGAAVGDVPIGHVTNGVHLPTWMAPPMQSLLERHLGRDWLDHPAEPDAWAGVDDIPDADLWAVRDELRAQLVASVRQRSTRDRLARGEPLDYVAAAAATFEPGRLTVGFARRLATYKRLHLLSLDPERAVALVRDHLQFVFAGKAHPLDEDAKRVAEDMFELKDEVGIAGRVAFLEDYGMAIAAPLVAGCDVWLNVPRPPFEASGTSGMKAALNGGLNVSILDGWWAEAYDGANGWAVDGDRDGGLDADGLDDDERDRHDASSLLDILERDVVPLFSRRDPDGIPQAWVGRVKASLRTIGPRFCATRMLQDYERVVYGVPSYAAG
jgi:starch phosphorylase